MKAGLTGGIASGKTFVAQVFAERGALVVDADQAAHRVLRSAPVLQAVVGLWGPGLLDAGGDVDRQALGRLIFADPKARQKLNRLTHPLILADLDERVAALERENPDRLVVAEIPLLFEVGDPWRFGPVIVAWCPGEVQRQRLSARDGFSAAEAEQRLAAQAPLDEKRARADFVVDTSGTLAQTRRRACRVLGQVCRRLGSQSGNPLQRPRPPSAP